MQETHSMKLKPSSTYSAWHRQWLGLPPNNITLTNVLEREEEEEDADEAHRCMHNRGIPACKEDDPNNKGKQCALVNASSMP